MTRESTASANDLPRLPACRLCHDRKIKCDSERPRCAPCSNQGSDCVMVSLDDGPPISRQYIFELEQKARGLDLGGQHKPREVPTVSESPVLTPNHVTENTTGTVPAVLQGGGLNFMSLLFNDPEWRKTNATLLQRLAAAVPPSELPTQPNDLPSAADARLLFDAYLDGPHIQHPFMLRKDVNDLYARVFLSENPESLLAQVLFRTFMILAVASVMPHRKGLHIAHPFGYYLAAMQKFDQRFLARGLPAIQDLLLVCRFGIYYDTRTSIWEVAHLCIRMCIEQGLHKSRVASTVLLRDQLERRVFWVSYLMDRYSSYTLNRPFAIADKDIQVGLPAHADDQEILKASEAISSLDSFSASHIPTVPNEMSVALGCIRLRKISSRIHYETSQLSKAPAVPAHEHDCLFTSGKIFMLLDVFSHELAEWRKSMPMFESPRCLFENDTWYDLLEARETLLLVRKGVDLIPKRNGLPPYNILASCLRCAQRVIVLYSSLFQQSMITYTRSYFQTIFTAGLSILFCISVSASMSRNDIENACSALLDCEEILKQMSVQLPDASPYATVFKELHRNIMQKLDHIQSCHPSIPTSPLAYDSSFPQPLLPGPNDMAGQGAMHAGNLQPLPATYSSYVQSSTYGTETLYAPHVGDGTVLGSNLSNGGDPSSWADFAYDTLWNFGNYSFAEVGDFHGVGSSVGFDMFSM